MKFRILVAEDEKNIREGLKDALELDGHEVASAEDGSEALKRFHKGDIDLVITDLKMPGLSGEELLEKVLVESPGTPVLFLPATGLWKTR